MSKKAGGIFAFLGLLGLSVFLLSCGTKVSRSSGLLFVTSQGANQVNSYAVDSNSGNLSFLKTSASTCATLNGNPPVPCGFPEAIMLDPTGSVAFVLDQGDPSHVDANGNLDAPPAIHSYSVKTDGSLAETGSPVKVGTSLSTDTTTGDTATAMARDGAGKFLFVVSQGATSLPAGCSTLNPPPNGCPAISVFLMQSGSTTLTPVTGSPFLLDRVPTSVSAITFTPPGSTTAETLLYVTSNKDLVGSNDNTVSEYIVDQSSGTVTEMTGSPYVAGSSPSAVLAVDTNPAGGNSGGLFVYATDQTTNNVSVFQVCIVENGNCTLQDVQDATMSAVGKPVSVGEAPVALAADPTNNFLYVVCETSNQVFAFRIATATGVLSGLNPLSVGTGTFPVAIAMHPSGKFLYVSNNASSNLSGFTVNTTSGALGNPITVISLGQPAGLVAK